MHIEQILSEIESRYKSVRSGLDVGFGDESASRAFAACRGGVWRTLQSGGKFPYADSQFQVVVIAPQAVSKETVREANRVLMPEGCMYFTVAERRSGSDEGFTAPEIYKLVREGFDIVSLNKPKWWNFWRRRGTVTVCARKKAWREHRGFSSGTCPLSPFTDSSRAAFAAALFLSLFFPSATFADGKNPAPKVRDNAIIRLLDSRAAASVVKYEEAAKIVAEDAALGKPLQQFVIALVSSEPYAPKYARIGEKKRKEYLDRSREKIKTLAEKNGNALAWYLLSMENNDRKMLKRAAEGENVQAMNAWGTIQLTEALTNPGIASNDVERILRKSFGYFKKAAEKKDPNGFYNLGMCYMNGYGTEQDVDMAYDSFKFAADAGHPEAMNNLGGFFRDGIVVEKDIHAATRWFKRSSDLGNPYGQLNYGLALQRGEGVDKPDPKAAAELFKASAMQGNADAMDAYAMCLYRGDGVKKNDRLAVTWYKRSAALGCAHAMENLAFCSAMGIGGMTTSQEEATVWKVRARAARGDSNAVAWLIQNGHAVR